MSKTDMGFVTRMSALILTIIEQKQMLHRARARPLNSFSHGYAVPAPSRRELFNQVIFYLGDKSKMFL